MQPSILEMEQMARAAGEILRAGYEQEHQVSYKGVIDLVTEVDHQSEAYLLGEILKRFPGHHIFAEESGVTSGRKDATWYVDPLDGTVNYAHHIPIFTVSIGYASNGSMSLAVVYDPMRDELYSAERGQGAKLNGNAIRVSEATELQKSLLVTGFPYDAWDSPYDNFENFIQLAKRSQGVRRLGSAALDCCYVACGRFDGFWEFKLNPWDVAAGILLVEEAGGKVTDFRNRPYEIYRGEILASNGKIHSEMVKVLQKGKIPARR